MLCDKLLNLFHIEIFLLDCPFKCTLGILELKFVEPEHRDHICLKCAIFVKILKSYKNIKQSYEYLANVSFNLTLSVKILFCLTFNLFLLNRFTLF
jgi:hypothetical protein